MTMSDEVVTPLSKYRSMCLTALLGGAVHYQVVHHLLGDGLQRPGPVSGRPPLPVLGQQVSPAQPLVEGPVDGHVQVAGHRPPTLGR